MPRPVSGPVPAIRRGRRRAGAGFSLIELMIVVAMIGVLAAIVVPRFSSASNQANDSAILSQLRRVRAQVEVYRSEVGADPDLITNQWADLTGSGYLKTVPVNPLNQSSTVAGAAGAGVGWVWRDKGNGTFVIFATDSTEAAEFVGP